MLRPAYLSKKLTPPVPTKDGGTLRTIQEACEYMAAIGEERELRRHWQHVRKLILDEEAHVLAVSWQLRLAILKDAKFDVTASPSRTDVNQAEPKAQPWAWPPQRARIARRIPPRVHRGNPAGARFHVAMRSPPVSAMR